MNTSAATAPLEFHTKITSVKWISTGDSFCERGTLENAWEFFFFFNFCFSCPSPVCRRLNTRLSGGNGQQHLGNCIQLTAHRTPSSEFVSFVFLLYGYPLPWHSNLHFCISQRLDSLNWILTRPILLLLVLWLFGPSATGGIICSSHFFFTVCHGLHVLCMPQLLVRDADTQIKTTT